MKVENSRRKHKYGRAQVPKPVGFGGIECQFNVHLLANL